MVNKHFNIVLCSTLEADQDTLVKQSQSHLCNIVMHHIVENFGGRKFWRSMHGFAKILLAIFPNTESVVDAVHQ